MSIKKNPVTPTAIEPTTFLLVAQFLNQLHHPVPHGKWVPLLNHLAAGIKSFSPELNPPPPTTLVAVRLFKGLTARRIYMSFGS